jgi:hypothetical protein
MTDLDSLLTQLSPALKGVGFVGVVTGVAKAFDWLDGGISPEGRKRLFKWLKNLPEDELIDTWAAVFPNLIDRVFGERAFSWRFFLRSCVASLIAVATMTMLCTATLGPRAVMGRLNLSQWTGIVLTSAICINCIPDYFSLLVSRSIVRSMAKHPKLVPVMMLLLLDSAATALLAATFVTLYQFIFLATVFLFTFLRASHGHSLQFGLIEALLYSARSTYKLNWSSPLSLISSLSSHLTRIFVLASFFTSIWVWLYVLASTSIRILHKARYVWTRIIPFLDVEKKPMTAIGRVAGLIAGAGYAIILVAEWAYQRLH